MKIRLQYIYTVSVFLGVLSTLYFMLSQDGGSRFPLRALQAPEEMRTEASIAPGLNQLFEVEKALSKLPKERAIIERRIPSESAGEYSDNPQDNSPSFEK